MRQHLAVFAALLILSSVLHAACDPKRDHRTNKGKGVIAENVTLNGTHGLDSADVSGIVGAVTGTCFDENADAIAQFIRDQLQQKGYLLAKVEHVQIEPSDALAVPKPAAIKADVAEGALFHVGDIRFKGNNAFNAEQMAAAFPLKQGDKFSTAAMRGGMGAIRSLYASAGYVDVILIPEFQMQSAQENPQASITVDVQEGKQYRMGKLRVFGAKDQAVKLQNQWTLAEGVPFDATYPHKFVQENRIELPNDFQERQGVHVYRDCSDGTVTVSIVLDWREAAAEPLAETGCETERPQHSR